MPDEAAVVGQIQTSDNTTPTAQPSEADQKPIKVLPTARLAFNKQLDVLRAYAVAGSANRAVSNADVADLTKLNVSSVAYNNPFFGDCGLIIKGGNAHTASPELIEYGRALGFEDERAPHKLAPVLRRTWFGDLIVRRVLYRPIPEKEAVTELAIASRANKEYEGQLRTLLDYLQLAGLITRESGTVSSGPTAKEQRMVDLDMGSQQGAEVTPRREQAAGGVATTFNHVPEGAISFSINVNVPLNELANWRPEVVSAFFAGVAQVVSAKAAVERALGGNKLA